MSYCFDSMEYEDMTAKQMFMELKGRLSDNGKTYLFLDETQEKFYLADTSLRYSVLGYNADSVAASLENVVYLELCRK